MEAENTYQAVIKTDDQEQHDANALNMSHPPTPSPLKKKDVSVKHFMKNKHHD